MSCGCRLQLSPDEWWASLELEARERVMGAMCHGSLLEEVSADEWWRRLRSVELRATVMRLSKPFLEHRTVG